MQYLVEGVAESDLGSCCEMVEVSADTVAKAVSAASERIGNKVFRDCEVRPTVRILTVFDEYGNQYVWVKNGQPAVENAIRNSYGHADAWKDHIHGHWQPVV